jgi:arylsulfatase A-like enzyme
MLGQLLAALDRHGLAVNTLVIATSDNSAEHRAYAPLRESKRSIYEGGHRVPFVARWPGLIQPGSVYDHTFCLNDLMATAAEIVGATLPPRTPAKTGSADLCFTRPHKKVHQVAAIWQATVVEFQVDSTCIPCCNTNPRGA